MTENPGDVSRMAFEAARDQSQSGAGGQIGFDGASGQYITEIASQAQEISGVQHNVTQTPGYPAVNWHTAGVSYTVPINFL